MAEKEFIVLTNEDSELVLVETKIVVEEIERDEEHYPTWLRAGDWLAVGERLRFQAIETRLRSPVTFKVIEMTHVP